MEGCVEERENGDRYLNICYVEQSNEVIDKFNYLGKGIKD